MKKLKRLLYTLSLLFLIQYPAAALEVPDQPQGRVHDAANILSAQEIETLTQRLSTFEQETSNQIVVALFPSLDGESLEDFSIRLAEQWKIGQKGKDNGIILLIFPNDRKLRIEVGYGLESWVPDVLASRIIENEIKPYFKEGKYYLGIQSGLEALIKASQGAYQADESTHEKDILGIPPIAFYVILFFVLGFGLIIYLANFTSLGLPSPNLYSSGSSTSSDLYSSSDSSSSSSDSFSGGGGSFGGGGSSGSW